MSWPAIGADRGAGGSLSGQGFRGCFSRAVATEFTRHLWNRLGYDRHDSATWTQPLVHLPARRTLNVRELAPKAWDAVCDLIGGAERIATNRPYVWTDGFIVDLGHRTDQPWAPASAASPGWHIPTDRAHRRGSSHPVAAGVAVGLAGTPALVFAWYWHNLHDTPDPDVGATTEAAALVT